MTKLLITITLLSLLLASCSLNSFKQVEIITPEKKIIQPLHKNSVISVDGKIGKVIIEVSNNQVRVKTSGCPDKICMKTGWISKQYEFILCAPNQVSVRILVLPWKIGDFITY